MAMSAMHRSKFAALHLQWWHLHMSEKFSSGTKETPKNQTKQKKRSFWLECIVKIAIIAGKK